VASRPTCWTDRSCHGASGGVGGVPPSNFRGRVAVCGSASGVVRRTRLECLLIPCASVRCWMRENGAGRRRRWGYCLPMSAAKQAFGELGERIAERWLRRQGWRVVQRRYRSGHRDIDLVVEREGTVAFVEVKARRGSQFGDPVEAVNWSKQKQLIRSASTWIDRHGKPSECYRFDVVGVLVEGERVRVRHIANAFSLPHSA
jgi:putative endonuclease